MIQFGWVWGRRTGVFVFLGRNLDPASLGSTIAGSENPGTPIGDVAQLVERLHGMQEVESSNLFVST